MRKKVYILKHVRSEGPARIGSFLKRRRIPFAILELWRGDPLPAVSDVGSVVSLGGPMNVYEEKKFPFLRDENAFIRALIKRNIPFLGVCLGAQLLAKAAGGRVYRARKKEIGWAMVRLTRIGKADRLFERLPSRVDVFQWHGDTFTIPKQGKLIFSGDEVRCQALKVGRSAYGLQFHIEANEAVLRKWFAGKKVLKRHLMHLRKIKKSYDRTADDVFRAFFSAASA